MCDTVRPITFLLWYNSGRCRRHVVVVNITRWGAVGLQKSHEVGNMNAKIGKIGKMGKMVMHQVVWAVGPEPSIGFPRMVAEVHNP